MNFCFCTFTAFCFCFFVLLIAPHMIMCVFGFAFPAFQLLRFPFFFFFSRVFSPLAATVHVRYINSSRNI